MMLSVFVLVFVDVCSADSLSSLTPGESDDGERAAGLRLRTVPGEVSGGDQECDPADPRGSPACHPWWVVSP